MLENKICPVCEKEGSKKDMIKNSPADVKDEWADFLHPECYEKCEQHEREKGLRL